MTIIGRRCIVLVDLTIYAVIVHGDVLTLDRLRSEYGMIYGIGVDIVEVAKVASSIHNYGDTYLNRMFTPKEIQYCTEAAKPEQRYAARIAAKEAAMKALSTGWDAGVQWLDFEVLNEDSGQPILLVHGVAKRLLSELAISGCWISLSHVTDYAIAQVIFEK